MTEPNDEFVVDPVVEDPEETQEEDVASPAQSIRVEETQEYKRAMEQLEQERQERLRLEGELRQVQQPPPKKDEPSTDPLDELEATLVEVEGKYQAINTWCELNPKSPDIVEGRAAREEARKQLLAVRKQLRKEAAKAHVDAVKGFAAQQTKIREESEHWQEQIASDPLCQELSDKAQALLLREIIVNRADPVKARTYFREMVGLDPNKATPGFRPKLQSLPGGRSNYIPMEGAGGGGSEPPDRKTEDQIVKRLVGKIMNS